MTNRSRSTGGSGSGGGSGHTHYVSRDEWRTEVRRQDERAEAQGRAIADLGDKMDRGFENLRITIASDQQRRDEQALADRRNKEVRWVPIIACLAGVAAVVVSIAIGVASVINSKIDTTNDHQDEKSELYHERGTEIRGYQDRIVEIYRAHGEREDQWQDLVAELRENQSDARIAAAETEIVALDERLQREMRDLDMGMRGEFTEKLNAIAEASKANAGSIETIGATVASLRATMEAINTNRFTGADGQRMRADLIEMILDVATELRKDEASSSAIDRESQSLSLSK